VAGARSPGKRPAGPQKTVVAQLRAIGERVARGITEKKFEDLYGLLCASDKAKTEIEFNNGTQGFTSYLTRYSLPPNGTRFPGRWYAFDLDPGHEGGKTSITINYYHAPGADKVPTPDYELFETTVLSKHTKRRRRW
jgi:hypothetical protein